MDVICPHIEWELGQPVEFFANKLRASENLAIAFLAPQRPGGIKIDLLRTPGLQRGSLEPDTIDGTTVAVLYEKKEKLGSQFTILLVQPMFGLPDLSCALDIG